MAQYITDKAGAVELLSLVTPNAAIDVNEALAGPAVYGNGFMVARHDGRYNGQDFLVVLHDFDKPTIERMRAACTCGGSENYRIDCPVDGMPAPATDPEAWVWQ